MPYLPPVSAAPTSLPGRASRLRPSCTSVTADILPDLSACLTNGINFLETFQ